MKETWKNVIDYEGLYEVSDLGRVKNARTGVILIGCPDKKGYLCVNLCQNGKPRTRKIHRLVCRAFHGPAPADKRQVMHLDNDPANNRAGNLAWGSAQDDADHKKRCDRQAKGAAHGQSKLTEQQVLRIRERRGGGEPLASIARDFNIGIPQVSQVARGKRWGWL